MAQPRRYPRFAITLPAAHARVLIEHADTFFAGNRSAAVANLIATNPVTKSRLELAEKATPRAA